MARASSVWFFTDESSTLPIAGFGLQYQAMDWYYKYQTGNLSIKLYRFRCRPPYAQPQEKPECIQVDIPTGKDIK